MKLLREISRAAKGCDVELALVRQGKKHEYWQCGEIKFAVPRHRDISAGTTEAIFRDLEPVLGKDWWRKR